MGSNGDGKLFQPIKSVAIIGMGYVGLPLASLVSKRYEVIGIDIDHQRIEQLKSGIDKTLEIDDATTLNKINFTTDFTAIKNVDLIIVTVPTPIDSTNNPNLVPLKRASKDIGQNISSGSVVVFESTVYPGVTEEILTPIIEKASGFEVNKEFFVGYSPERINPGDKKRGLHSITKVTSGSTLNAAQFIDEFYSSVIDAGTHMAPSIQVAEAAKVIENIQRDLNIALVNELSLIFSKLEIDTSDVLDAASTKWNFVRYSPGLVGGHCIGVDPYYLTYRAKEIGYMPRVILAGRELNDGMHSEVVNISIKELIKNKINIGGLRRLCWDILLKKIVLISEIHGWNFW